MRFDEQCLHWGVHTFGKTIATDKNERSMRLLEEALELVQARGLDKATVLNLIDHVYERPPGEAVQEIGGVMVTLGLLTASSSLNMYEWGWYELMRCWKSSEKIAQKHLMKQEKGIAIKQPLPK